MKYFKTWQYNLKSYQNETLIFMNNNNLNQFIDTKNFSLKKA